MVAATPKRGDQLTLWDGDEESGTGAAARPAPLPVVAERHRRKAAPGQLTLAAVDLETPDPEAWLTARGGLCVPQAAVDAVGQQFRANLEHWRSKSGRVFEDKDGWHLLAAWAARNEAGLWDCAYKVAMACPWIERDDAFGELGVKLIAWARWIRPAVERAGRMRGCRMLTVVRTFGVSKLIKVARLAPRAAQFAEDFREDSIPAREGASVEEVPEQLARALAAMRGRERRAVRLRMLHGMRLRSIAKRLGTDVPGVVALIESGIRRAQMARKGGGE